VNKNWSENRFFDFIAEMDDTKCNAIKSGKFPLINTDINVGDTSDEVGYACYVSAMNSIIEAFPNHFPSSDGQEHSFIGELEQSIHSPPTILTPLGSERKSSEGEKERPTESQGSYALPAHPSG
jgi:hypothetical protein